MAPVVPASPVPLTPSGLVGDATEWSQSFTSPRMSARGIEQKSTKPEHSHLTLSPNARLAPPRASGGVGRDSTTAGAGGAPPGGAEKAGPAPARFFFVFPHSPART